MGMDDPNIVQWLVGQVGIGGLAGFALFTLNANHKVALAKAEEYAAANREDKKHMLEVLERNTQALTKLASMIEARAHER